MLEYLFILIVVAWSLFMLLLMFWKSDEAAIASGPSQPMVSILIAARNEEKNVQRMCQSLAQLSYPESCYEVLIGDDASDDRTLQLLERYRPVNATIYSFNEGQTGRFGKQKVLAQLTKKARGEYFLFTDADMMFHPDWIQGQLHGASDPNKLMVGLTKVSGKGWFARMQHLDWMINERIISWFAHWGIGLTAWGNNMLIRKEKYVSIGGHEALKDTIVEDVGLLHQVIDSGGQLKVNMRPEAVGSTRPAQDLGALLSQRKRWMRGITRTRLALILGFLLKIMFWPAIVYLAMQSHWWLLVAALAIIGKSITLFRLAKLTRTNVSMIDLLMFEVYDFVFYLITFAFYLLPVSAKVTWKGREY